MKYRNIVLGILLVVSPMRAQTQRTGQRQSRPATTSTPPARPAATQTAQAAPGTLALINGQAITLADFDPQARDVIEGFDKRLPDLRRDALDARINTLLLQAEAQKRKVTLEQLIDAEVTNKIKDPTDAEIQAVYEANRQQIGSADMASVRPKIIDYLRGQAGQKLEDDLVKSLRATHQVVMGTTDVNAANLTPATVLATVDGQAITDGDFEERLKPFVYKLRHQIYESEMRALDLMINQQLLTAEAKRLNSTPEAVYKAEVESKVQEPTEAEVTKFYEANKSRIQGDLNTLRPDIVELLKNEQRNRLDSALAQRLRSGTKVQIFLVEPQPPVQLISTGNSPARGDASAPVTIVEFTDFQCPACAAMNPAVEDALKTYGNRVRLVVRDFPLSMHANARRAAEAAFAAYAQGKFFEYISILFKNQSALDDASLKKYASDLGLDRAKFDAALESGQYAAQVNRDVEDGETYGVEATPTFFINGVVLRNVTPEGLRAAIDSALAAKNAQPPKSAAR